MTLEEQAERTAAALEAYAAIMQRLAGSIRAGGVTGPQAFERMSRDLQAASTRITGEIRILSALLLQLAAPHKN